MDRIAKRILVLDDDPQIRELLTGYLGDAGFDVQSVGTGAEFTSAVHSNAYDLIIFDLLLPDADGVTLMVKFRGSYDTPVVILTTKTDEVERIVGLEVGADDYVSKPFSPRELLARIKSIFRRIETSSRREHAERGTHLRVAFADWRFDLTSRRLVHREGTEKRLTNSEFQLLAAFVERPRHVLSRDQLLEFSRKDPDTVFDRSIDYLVLRLRRKLEDNPRRPELIKTEHGAGYVFTPEVVRY